MIDAIVSIRSRFFYYLSHRFELDECVNGIVGCSFTLEDVPKFHIEIEHDEGKIEFGKEFRC